MSLGGHSQIEGWTPEVSVEFPFENMTQEEGWEDPKPEQPDKGETGGSGDTVTDEDTEVITATQLPESESIWGPFFVWKAEPLSGEAVVATLVSPRQWLVKRLRLLLFVLRMRKMAFAVGALLLRKKPRSFGNNTVLQSCRLVRCSGKWTGCFQ